MIKLVYADGYTVEIQRSELPVCVPFTVMAFMDWICMHDLDEARAIMRYRVIAPIYQHGELVSVELGQP